MSQENEYIIDNKRRAIIRPDGTECDILHTAILRELNALHARAEKAKAALLLTESGNQALASVALIMEQKARAEKAEAELAELREDKARLDWFGSAHPFIKWGVIDPYPCGWSRDHDDSLRATIDAARKAAK